MSEGCSHDCANCESKCDKESMLASLREGCRVKKVIGVMSGKGGVGKSMVTSLLAVLSARAGLKTAVLDADITGPSVPKAFGLTEMAMGDGQAIYPVKTRMGIDVMSINLLLENATDPVVWRGPLIAGTVRQFWTDVQWGDQDIMFIDMPPGTGDVGLTVFQSIPVDGVVVVASPQALVGMIVEKSVKMAEMMNIPVVGLVENMSYVDCEDCGKRIYPFGASRADALAKAHDIPVVAKLPISPKLAEACDAGLIERFDMNDLDELAKSLFHSLGSQN